MPAVTIKHTIMNYEQELLIKVLAEARAKGKEEGKAEVARKMLEAGLCFDEIQLFTGLNETEILNTEINTEIQMNEELKDKLVAWRAEQYKAANVRAYMVMHQRTLLEIATKIPKTKDELMAIHGFGDAKWEKYGQQILQITSGY